MYYQWQFRPYQRCFKQALRTSHGVWAVRDGIILQLLDTTGAIGWGEIAPIPWFGSETLEQALTFCHQQPAELSKEMIFSIPDTLPACQFAFESAWDAIEAQRSRTSERRKHQDEGHQRLATTPDSLSSTYSALLPAGEMALQTWKPLWEQGFRTFKWKIGVAAIDLELEFLHILMQTLPKGAKLRLDANAGLNANEAMRWLQTCDAINADSNSRVEIEYIEQPLPIAQFQDMQDLRQQHRTPIALDESVATLHQLKTCYEAGWRGIFVIKPAIVGSPSRLRRFCQNYALDAVFSSALETAIGRQAGLKLAKELANRERALGYGTAPWFNGAETTDFEQLWQTL